MQNTKRIAVNTFIMYGRMLFIMILSLYSVRVLLHALGVEDYGIYNVVSGVVSMLAIVSSTMEAATQRFYSFAIGEKRQGGINQIFNLSCMIYIIISILLILIAETFGFWFLNTYLQIPAQRIIATNWIYQFAIISIVFTMLSIPFSSLIIAYEDMGVFAIISIVDAILKLAIVFAISLFSFDKLIIYGILGVLVVVVKFLFYVYSCHRKYEECRFRFYWDSKLFKSMLSYSGWTFYGAVAGVANNQGNNILINIFFGPVANAARGIAFQVSSAVSSFCSNLFLVVRPPIIKSFAEKNISYMMYLFYLSSKLSYYLMFMILVPLYLECEYVLNLWLGEVDDYMVIFTKLTLIYTFILSQHGPITTVIQATGQVKKYFTIVETVTLLSLPFTYLAFKMGYSATATFYISILVFFIAHLIRLFILYGVIEFSIIEYMKKFLIPILLVTVLSLILPYLISQSLPFGIIRFIVVLIVSTLSTLLTIYFLGVNRMERFKIQRLINKVTKNRFIKLIK